MNQPLSCTEDTCQIPCFKPELVGRLREALPEAEALDEALVRFSALADRTRLRILHALRDGEELCVCDVAHVLGASISNTSHHLRKLKDQRILRARNDGRMAYYALRDPQVARILAEAFEEAP